MKQDRLARSGARTWVAACLALTGALLGESTPSAAQMVTVDETVPSGAESHRVAEGETLFQVAEQHLGNGDDWPKLWSYNPEITNPHWIYPGHVLRLAQGAHVEAQAAGDEAGEGGPGPGGGSAGGGLRSRLGIARRAAQPAGTVVLGEEVYLDKDALGHTARIVGSKADHLMLSPGDEVYLRFKRAETVPRAGQELTVFLRLQRAEIGPKAGPVRVYSSAGGTVVRVVGGLRIKDYDPDKRIARAVVTEALEPIERGFEVADLPRRLAQVSPRKNSRSLRTKILLATRALGMLGQHQLVFLDAGQRQGIELGNRLWVVRQGDPWRQQLQQKADLTGAERPDEHKVADRELPSERVAELRVLYVRPDTATALITSAAIELSPGEKVEMQAGD